jgi:hypothetical protein
LSKNNTEPATVSVGNFHWILLVYEELWFFLQFGASHLHFLMILVTNKFSNDVSRFTITSCLQPVQIVEFYFRRKFNMLTNELKDVKHDLKQQSERITAEEFHYNIMGTRVEKTESEVDLLRW